MEELKLNKFETNKEAKINGQQLTYKTVCGDVPVRGTEGSLLGTMFYYSYLRTDAEDRETRPVLFAYNGGPGSSAMWLHTGLLGTKRVRLDCPTEPPAVPPYEIEENPYCLLDLCDIVMIDPLGTGYSQVLQPELAKEAYSMEQDARIFADFILKWTEENGRWNSPKYLLGESYGTMRSSILASTLMGGPTQAGAAATGMAIDGIIMMGSGIMVNPNPNLWDEYGVERISLDLPTMAAVSWYFDHEGKPGLRDFVEEAYAFASDVCLPCLYKARRMGREEESNFMAKLAYYTGLSVKILKRYGHRISLGAFAGELLRDRGLEAGMYDGRFTMALAGEKIGMADPVTDDPAMGAYTPAFRAAFAQIAEELNIQLERDYRIIDFNVNGMWRYDGLRSPFQYLQAALRRNPQLRVMFCDGLYDLVTTVGQARYAAAHLQSREGQVIVKEYPSGHMPYIGEESGAQLAEDLRAFISKEEMESCF